MAPQCYKRHFHSCGKDSAFRNLFNPPSIFPLLGPDRQGPIYLLLEYWKLENDARIGRLSPLPSLASAQNGERRSDKLGPSLEGPHEEVTPQDQ